MYFHLKYAEALNVMQEYDAMLLAIKESKQNLVHTMIQHIEVAA